MSVTVSSADADLPASTDEAGTAPGDRRFRPDIEGLRAVAVLLVVFYHAGFSGLSGGYVGVDVFFVISGFVITGVLLRERASTYKTSLVSFYGRRSRRIIPAATAVIVITIVVTYAVLGIVYGNQTAVDARWTAIFLANFHFASIGTNYLTAQQPPSPLLNFWSLAVEEQFYLIYPSIFLLIAAIRTRIPLYARLRIGLVAIIVASFALSVIQTASDPTVAYFSPFTRAWELALGALVAISTRWLLQIPRVLGSIMTWAGLAAIVFASIGFNGHTAYPGALVAVPVIGASLVIAGGVSTPRWAAESMLGLAPFRWFGKLSYSIYLWHWPILIVAADEAGKASLPFRQNVVWLVVALAASVVTFYLIENPIRHATFPKLGRWAPIGLGSALIAVSLGVSTVELNVNEGSPPISISRQAISNAIAHLSVASSDAAVKKAVERARTIRSLPPNLTPALTGIPLSLGAPFAPCWPTYGQSSIPACVFGDRTATRTMVLYGDSHAGMWFDAMNLIATVAHWKLVILGKGNCPADSLQYANPLGFGPAEGEFAACAQWHRFAIDRINKLDPDLVIITQEVRGQPDGRPYTAQQWQQGLDSTIQQLHVPTRKIVVLGNIPILPQSGPQCLSRNSANVQACSGPESSYWKQYLHAEQMAASNVGARYVNVLPWFCSTTCTAVIGKFEVYFDRYHVTAAYTFYLARVLGQALSLSPLM
jgi:peptidoglycan/LPS O-acetylase OafA/YrhL